MGRACAIAVWILAASALGCPETPASSTDADAGSTGDGGVVQPPDIEAPDDLPPPDNTPECTKVCGGKICGPDGCGGVCGECGSDEECTGAGACQSTEGKQLFGQACGPTANCVPSFDGPTGAANSAWPGCLHDQCASDLCSQPVCTRTCAFARDEVVNATGSAGPDGIEDPGFDSCDGASDGPLGTEYRCANLASFDLLPDAVCLAGTDFESCASSADCPEGEVCSVMTLLGVPSARCMTAMTDGLGTGAPCASDVPGAGYCEAPILCLEDGCTALCTVDSECLTEGAACAEGVCASNADVTCRADGDCSPWSCSPVDDPQLFDSGVDGICSPARCERDLDCIDPAYVCEFRLGSPVEGVADWAHTCSQAAPDANATVGELCDNDPASGIVCDNPDLCYKGQCSTLCTADSDCASDAHQICAIAELPVDLDGDEKMDQALALSLCEPVPHEGDLTACETNADCAEPGEVCTPIELVSEGPSSFPYQIQQICRLAPEGFGGFGDPCGLLPGEGECQIGFCTTDDIHQSTPDLCTETCAGHESCPKWTTPEGDAPSVCRSVIYGWNASPDPEDDLYVPICWPVELGSSKESCETDLTCASDDEVCTAWPIATSPSDGGSVEYLCVTHPQPDAAGVGAVCEKHSDCASLLCLPDVRGARYCSALCSSDAECVDGGPFMVCDDHVEIPRKSVALDIVIRQCRKEKTCVPCSSHNDCTGDMRCVSVGGTAQAETICAHPCQTDGDCEATDGGSECVEAQGPEAVAKMWMTCAPATCK